MLPVNRLDDLKCSFDQVADDIPQILWSIDAEGRHDYVNRELRKFVGERMDSIDASNWTSLIHPEDRAYVEQRATELLASREPYELEYRLLHHSGEYRWLRLKAVPKIDEDGCVLRWYGTSNDIHLEKTIALERELVALELDHRIKNLFTLVNGLVSLSVRETPELAPVADRLKQRLTALHNAHQYVRISGTRPHSVAAEEGVKGLIQAILRPYDGRNGAPAAKIVGADAPIDTGETTSFALLIHELATNSVKYGALSAPDGELSIRIVNKDHALRLSWLESASLILAHAGPDSGFGSTLLKLVVEKQLSGKIARRRGRGYLCYVLTFPRAT